MTELQISLKKCRVEANVLYLPTQQITNYQEVRKALLNAGAKYKSNTFVFPNAAQPYIDRLMGGDKVNIKKEFQFFGTPQELAAEVVGYARIEKGNKVSEPSAGQGAIVNAILSTGMVDIVDCCELMDINKNILLKNKAVNFICDDFLQIPAKYYGYYDRIIANPPFNKNQDIDHIYKMYQCLAPEGRLVSIASKSWEIGSQKKQVAFKNWLDEVEARYYDIPAGSFKESGTMVGGYIIVIDK